MPELPEVETVRRNLTEAVSGRTIIDVVSSNRHRGVANENISSICGARIAAVDRKGKFLILDLGSCALVVHLGMSGRLLIREIGSYAIGPHDHVRIRTDASGLLVFQDHRRFGRMFLSPSDLSNLPVLGSDPVHSPFTGERLMEILGRRRTAIKILLMQQSLIAGLGNIYACEILWAVGLAPSRPGSSLRLAECRRLAAAISDVLRRAVAAGGATLEDYRGTSGEMGTFDSSFAVYARQGMACRRCSAHIAVETLAGRVTYRCSGCQS
jgi:formamidopyrimidine-DNA glycosylase